MRCGPCSGEAQEREQQQVPEMALGALLARAHHPGSVPRSCWGRGLPGLGRWFHATSPVFVSGVEGERVGWGKVPRQPCRYRSRLALQQG